MDYSYTSKERSKGEECVRRSALKVPHMPCPEGYLDSVLRAASDLYPTGHPYHARKRSPRSAPKVLHMR